MKKPIIGITLDFIKYSDDLNRYSASPWYALRQNYAHSIKVAGGVPILIPHNHDLIEDILDTINGLIIPGGAFDIDPTLYGEKIISDKVVLNTDRSNFEIAITKRALERGIPFLGICNGMQLLNVLCGGSLFQHLPDHINDGINHEQPVPKNVPSHLIHIKPNTVLSMLTNTDTAMVNSTHHQAVNRLGTNLIASAIALDGVIEAIELANAKFVIGVEWHPEYLETDLDVKLFKAFIDAATSLCA